MVAVVKRAGEVGRAKLFLRTGGVLAQRVLFDAATHLLPGFATAPEFVF
jgi:protein-L-isoaspartate(D-aspartate) O-methyltransferase